MVVVQGRQISVEVIVMFHSSVLWMVNIDCVVH